MMFSEQEISIGPAEWQMWLELPTTKAVFEALSHERSLIVQRLAFGDTINRPGLELVETAKAVGIVAGLTILLEDLNYVLQQQWSEAQERKQKEEEETEGV